MRLVHRYRLATVSVAALLAGASPALAQERHGFVANFHENYSPSNTLSLVVFGEAGTVGTISNVDGFSLDFTIDDTGVFQTALSRADAQMNMDGAVNGRSLLVTADNPISGIALNREDETSDQTALLQFNALGTEYYALGYKGIGSTQGSQLSITAVEDGTEVTINSPAAMSGGVAANTPFTVTLNAGQSVSFSTAGSDDVSGAHIVSNLPIAVFGGARCTQVPTGLPACDHLIEQNFSVENFATEFHLSQNFGGGTDADLIRVVAAQDDTEIFLNGVSQGVIGAGEFLEIDRVGNGLLTASKPVQLGQYMRGQNGTRVLGDPAFAIVPGVDQWLDSYVYATPIGSEAFTQNFLNVAISQEDAASLVLNGAAVDSSGFVRLNDFLYGNIAVDAGFGLISADNPFLAMIAGFGDYDSYFSAIATSFSSGASPPPDGLRDITLADDVDSQLGVTLNPIFAGGTLNASVDQTRDFQIRNAGGSIATAEGVSVVYSGVISDFAGDSGGLAKRGAGVLTLSGDNTYTGGTLVAEGTLALTDGASLAGGVVNNAAFATSGTGSVAGNFLNQGAINLGAAGAGDQLNIGGSYSATNGVLNVGVALAGSGGTADKLVIAGDVGAGSTLVNATLTGRGGLTGRGAGQGIAVVEVGGATDAADFALAGGRVQNNVFLYDLNLGTDDVWRLQSSYLPTIPTYEAYPSALLNASQPPRLRDRVGDRSSAGPGGVVATPGWLGATEGAPLSPEMWVRAEGSWLRSGRESSTTDARYDQNIARIQAGVDVPVGQFAGGELVAGLNLQYANSSVDVESPHGDGGLDLDSYGVGGTVTWYGSDGLYVDGQATYLRHDADLGSWVSGNDASSVALSIEAGKRLALTPTWSVTPQAQVSWVTTDFDDFTGPYGENVSMRDGDSLRLRVGATFDRQWGAAENPNALFVSTNVIAAGDRTTRIDVRTGDNVYPFERRSASAYGEVGVGGQIALTPSAYVGGAVYVDRGFGGDSKTNVRGNATLNISW